MAESQMSSEGLTQRPQRAARQRFNDSDLVFTDDRSPVEFIANSLVLRFALEEAARNSFWRSCECDDVGRLRMLFSVNVGFVDH
jgi:hypothetical protein